MSTAPLVRVERRGIVLFLTLDDPSTRNAMSPEMTAQIGDAIATLADDPARCVVIRGANGTFSSGGNIQRFAADAATEATAGDDPVRVANRAFGKVLEALEAAPQLVVAMVEGTAFGGGCGLACASDVVIALASTRFALSETTLGVVPAQISPFVVRRLGVPRARRLTMTGARFDGAAAMTYGLIDMLCADEDAMARVLADVVAGVGRCAPRANAMTKALFGLAAERPAAETLDIAADMFARALRNEGREGAAAFLGKRQPGWVPKDQ